MAMICSVKTLGISGIQGSLVTAECYISNGLPGFDIVGLPDAAVKEARERVRAAAKSSGLGFPASRITVNLAPAGLKKTGTHYDLPILLGILCALGSVRRPRPDCAFLGEVSLDGQIRPVSGVLPMALAAKREGRAGAVRPGGKRGGGHAGPGACHHSRDFHPPAGRRPERGDGIYGAAALGAGGKYRAGAGF